ncbi:hypothetical protein [Burkholderia cenocepacia]|uniref:hypothetical protein n=1 Tax=Burkholderia cenocepacia TaxID=95486 RepID=UPI000F65F4D1|nr:hypothetical protein [Burkholderia cenocepacia]
MQQVADLLHPSYATVYEKRKNDGLLPATGVSRLAHHAPTSSPAHRNERKSTPAIAAGRWRIRVSIRKDKESGVYFVDLYAPSGERVRRSARTSDRKEAQEYHDRLKAQCWRQSMLGEQPEHTFEDGAVRFLRAHEGEKDYAAKVRHIRHWNEMFAGRALRSLTADDIEDALSTESVHLHKRGGRFPVRRRIGISLLSKLSRAPTRSE